MLATQTRTAFGTARPTRVAPSLARCGLKVQCLAQPSRANAAKAQENVVNPVLFAGALAAPFLFEALPALATGELKMIRHAASSSVNVAQRM
jgi:hypothetical protein